MCGSDCVLTQSWVALHGYCQRPALGCTHPSSPCRSAGGEPCHMAGRWQSQKVGGGRWRWAYIEAPLVHLNYLQ